MSQFDEFDGRDSRPNVSVGGIISHAFENYKKVIGYAILILIISFLVSSLFSTIIERASGFDTRAFSEMVKDERISQEDIFKMESFHLYFGLSLLSAVLLFPFKMSFMYVLHKANVGKTIYFSDIFEGYRRNSGKVIGYYIISGVLSTIGFALCVFPGFALLPFIFIGYAVVFFENKTPISALFQSFKDSKSYFWTLFGVGILSFLISLSGFLLCGIGVIITVMFTYASLYSAYCALYGTPNIKLQ